ncbi:MAG: DUF6531 domain-containing protein [Polyangia bacterium]
MIAAKHFDPIIGIDIHLIITPAGVTVPIPHPYIGLVLDPMDWVPFIGASVKVNGLPRGQAGTAGKAIPPHIPIGGVFAKPPTNESEIFMGSATVLADGEPLSRLGLPVLSCQDIGLRAPPRPKKKSKTVSMVLPTSVVLAIPMGQPVLVGGPPTISLMAIGMRIGMAALGRFFKSGLGRRLLDKFQKFRQKLFKNLKPGFLKCNILKAEPVDITTGEVVVEQEDFALQWPVPLAWRRHYRSHATRTGACGVGWQTPADARLVLEEDGAVCFYDGGPGATYFPELPKDAPVRELVDGAELSAEAGGLRVRVKGGLSYLFPQLAAGATEVRVRRIEDRRGHSLSYLRDDAGLTAIECSAGPRIAVRSERGLIKEMWLEEEPQGPRRLLVRYEQDESRDLTAVIDALGAPYRFRYEGHRMLQHTDRNGLSFYYEFDRAEPGARVVHAFGDGGLYDYRFAYDPSDREVRCTDSLGHPCVIRFDENHLPVEETDALGGVTCFEYDDCGRTTAVVDPAGHRTEYHYDEHGNLVQLVRPDGSALAMVYDDADQLTALSDADGATWQQAWDERGLLVRQVSPTGAEQRFEYTSDGFLTGYTDELGAYTRVQTDRLGQARALIDPLGHATELALDPLGRVTAERDPLGRQTRYRYDRKSRLVEVQRPSGAQIRCEYDAEDNLTAYVDEEGHRTELMYRGLGEVACRKQPDGHEVRYTYDNEERLIAVTNQRGETYRLVRDALGRIVEEVDYWGQARRYTYGASGHLVRSEDALGRVIDYETDALGRLVKKHLPDGTVEEFSYDGAGNLAGTRNPDCEVRRLFDAEGRLLEEKQGDFTIKNTYDAAGRRTRRETSHGNVIEYRYDPLGRVTEIKVNDNEPIRIKRDAAGQAIEERLSPALLRRYRYDADGQVTKQEILKEGSSLFCREYEYDRTGNLVKRRDSRSGVERFLYDPMGRVREHIDPLGQVTKYLHDPAGDLQRATPDPDSHGETGPAWSRRTEYNGVTYRYDAAGNLTERKDKDGTVLRLYWDANNRLVRSRRGDGPETTYGYDAQGRRVFKETEGRRTKFWWDGDALVSDQYESVHREHVYWPRTFRLAAVQVNSDRMVHVQTDPNGFITEMLYDEFSGVSSPEDRQQLRIKENIGPNQYFDTESNLYYNRYRYYDSHIDSFVSPDLLGIGPAVNLYAYAPNNISWSDPLGLNCIPWSSKRIKDADNLLEGGQKKVYVGSRSEAEELFLGRYQGHGYKNTTGMTGPEVKNLFGEKKGTYHWDTQLDSTGRVVGHGPSNPDGAMPHLQVHTHDGDIIHIFFPP